MVAGADQTNPVAADPMVPKVFRITGCYGETGDTFTLELKPPAGEFPFAPGQFNMLYVFGIGEVPISISGDPMHTNKLVHTWLGDSGDQPPGRGRQSGSQGTFWARLAAAGGAWPGRGDHRRWSRFGASSPGHLPSLEASRTLWSDNCPMRCPQPGGSPF